MSFSFCLNKNELLLLAGFGLLYQGLELDRKGRLIQDSQRLISSVIEVLDRNGAPGAVDFKKIACAMTSVDRLHKDVVALDDKIATRSMSDDSTPASKSTSRSPRNTLQAFASRFTSTTASLPLKREITWGRRCTVSDVASSHNAAIYARSDSQNSVSSVASELTHRNAHHRMTTAQSSDHAAQVETPNLDYLSFANEQDPAPYHYTASNNKTKDTHVDRLTGFSPKQQIEAPFNSLFPSSDVLSSYMSPSPCSAIHDWTSDIWGMPPQPSNGPASAHSVPSFSEEDFTSGEELSICDLTGKFPGIAMPNVEDLDGFEGSGSTLGL